METSIWSMWHCSRNNITLCSKSWEHNRKWISR